MPNPALRFFVIGLLLVGAVAGIAVIARQDGDAIDFIISPTFVIGYTLLLAVIGARRVLGDLRALRREGRQVREFQAVLADIPDPAAKANYLTSLLDVDDPASPAPVRAMRDAFASSDLLSRLGLLLKHAKATVPSALYEQGVIPAQFALKAYGAGKRYETAETADLVVRIALLGTFVGIIAALTIASEGLVGGQEAGTDRVAEIQNFMQQLLATAAAKFWISAAGLAGAIFLRVIEKPLLARAVRMRLEVGALADSLLQSDAFARRFCKPEDHQTDPIRDQLHVLAEQIKAAADRWVLTVQIGGANAPNVPAVALRQVAATD